MGQEWNLKKLDLQVDKTNKRYYGELRGDISNVVFIHGEDDIWKSLGLSESSIESVDVILMSKMGVIVLNLTNCILIQ